MVMGLSLPTTAVYILLAVLIGPALTKAGIEPLAAHLFIFYFGMLSTITPPVCLAAYTAASLARPDPMSTGWESMRLGVLAYIVPFVFVFSPALLLRGSWDVVTWTLCSATIGTVMVGIGLVGHLFQPLGVVKRALFLIAATGLFIPVAQGGKSMASAWMINAAAFFLPSILVVIEWLRRNPKAVSENDSAQTSVG